MGSSFFLKVFAIGGLFFLLIACSAEEQASPLHSAEKPPQQVGVMKLKAESVTVSEKLSGRIEASRVAEVRARVSGIVQKRFFTEGATVKRDDLLFQIDSAPYKAKLALAEADLAKAKSMVKEAEYQAKRYGKLLKDNAVSESEKVGADAELGQALAELAAAKANVQTARINLDYTRVTAPIDGRIGHAFVTEGALVSETAATAMAKIQQINPVYINLQQDAESLLHRYQSVRQKKLKLADVDLPVEVLLGKTRYPQQGKLLFSGVEVDQSTGQLLVRAEIPNPDTMLLPGMFVQVSVRQAVWPNAFLVPQRAVMRDEAGDRVYLVSANNTVTSREVTVSGAVDSMWLLTEGVENGEQLMLDGFQKAYLGSTVTPIMIQAGEQGAQQNKPQNVGQEIESPVGDANAKAVSKIDSATPTQKPE